MKTETDTQTELEVGGIGAIKPHTSARNIWVSLNAVFSYPLVGLGHHKPISTPVLLTTALAFV